MRVAVFSTKSYDKEFLERANAEFQHELAFYEPRLTREAGECRNEINIEQLRKGA